MKAHSKQDSMTLDGESASYNAKRGSYKYQ